jgi:hypothetical protein
LFVCLFVCLFFCCFEFLLLLFFFSFLFSLFILLFWVLLVVVSLFCSFLFCFIRNIYDNTISSFFADTKMQYLFLLAVLLPMILGAPQERFLCKLGFLFT